MTAIFRGAVKEPNLVEALERLESRLGAEFFILADQWETDLAAIGICSPTAPSRLVYISTWQKPAGHFHVSLETPGQTDVVFELVDDTELERLINEHFKR